MWSLGLWPSVLRTFSPACKLKRVHLEPMNALACCTSNVHPYLYRGLSVVEHPPICTWWTPLLMKQHTSHPFSSLQALFSSYLFMPSPYRSNRSKPVDSSLKMSNSAPGHTTLVPADLFAPGIHLTSSKCQISPIKKLLSQETLAAFRPVTSGPHPKLSEFVWI